MKATSPVVSYEFWKRHLSSKELITEEQLLVGYHAYCRVTAEAIARFREREVERQRRQEHFFQHA